jgi:hypothetical protein
MLFVSNGGKFKLYTVLDSLIFPTPTQPRISFERAILTVYPTTFFAQSLIRKKNGFEVIFFDRNILKTYYFTLFYPTGFKGFLYFTVLNKLTIPKSFFFLF